MQTTTNRVLSGRTFPRLSLVLRQIWLYAALLFSLPVLAQPTPEEVAKLVASDGKAYDYFGVAVATDGNTAVIGTAKSVDPSVAGSESLPGTVYVFSLNNGTWIQTATLTASDGQLNDYFGRSSLAVSGNTIVVGASGAKGGGQGKRGAAYVFTRNNGTWTETAKLTGSDASSLGGPVAISGNTIIVRGVVASAQEVVYVYTLSNGTWQQTAKLTASNSVSFGLSLAISGNIIIVGAPYATTQGIVYVFTLSNGTWQQTAELAASDGKENDSFGDPVSLSGNTAVVATNTSGAAYVFTLGNGNWTQTAKLVVNDETFFGPSLAISGNTIIESSRFTSQAAYVFSLINGTWRQTARLTDSGNASNSSYFGSALAISGNTVFVGEFGTKVNGQNNQGVVYVYEVKDFGLEAPDSLSVAVNQTLTESQTAILDLAWQDTQNETGYLLESITGNFETGSGLTRDTLPANTTQVAFRAARTPTNSLRSFRLYAFNQEDISPYSNVAFLNVLPSIPFRLNAGASRPVFRNGYTFAPDQFFSGNS